MLRYRLSYSGSAWTSLVLVLDFLLMALGVGAAVLVARRITLSPLKELSEDVAALRNACQESQRRASKLDGSIRGVAGGPVGKRR